MLPSRPVTIKTIAKELNLSISAVSKALNDYPDIGEETKKVIVRKALEMGYRPNLIARSLVTNSSNTIGMIVRDSATVYGEMFKLLSQKAESLKLNLLVGDSNRNPDLELSHVKNMVDSHVMGIIITPVSGDISGIKKLVGGRVPVVYLGGRITDSAECFVASDNRNGSNMAMDYLFSLGHRDIAFISDRNRSNSTQVKLDSYICRMKERNLEPAIFIDDDINPNLVDVGCRQAKAMIESKRAFTAVFASKDMVALGVMKELGSKGFRIPEDISVIGYDGSEASSMPMIELTTVAQPKEDLSDNLIRILLSQVNAGSGIMPEHYLATPELIIRNSCGKVRRPPQEK